MLCQVLRLCGQPSRAAAVRGHLRAAGHGGKPADQYQHKRVPGEHCLGVLPGEPMHAGWCFKRSRPHAPSPPPLLLLPSPPPPGSQDRIQRCVQRCQDKAQEQLPSQPSPKDIEKAQALLANCAADCAVEYEKQVPKLQKDVVQRLAQAR